MEKTKLKKTTGGIVGFYVKWGQRSFFFTLICIGWLAWRVGTKPTRLNYPCSQFALWQIVIYTGSLSLPLIGICQKCISYFRRREYFKIAGIALIILALLGVFSFYNDYRDNQLRIAGSGTIPVSASTFNPLNNPTSSESIDAYLEFPNTISTDHAVVSVSHDPLVYYGGASPYNADVNPAYDYVWETVARLQLGDPGNPLDTLIDAGNTVLIKPNWVDYGSGVYTRPEVIRPLIDMAVIAGASNIYIGDGGGSVSNTESVMDNGNFTAMVDELDSLYPGVHIEAICLSTLSYGWHWISLGDNSSFAGSGYSHYDLAAGGATLYGHTYYSTPDGYGVNPGGDTLGWYAVSNKILQADVVINVSKMKTHQSMIATMSIKNLVGCTIGSTYDEQMGDCQPRIPHHNTAQEENYFNNDIFWRSILDMNKILMFSDEDGNLQSTQQRKYLNVVDGIQAMEKSQHTVWGGGGITYDRNVVLAGIDPVAVDAVGCRIMGYDYSIIPSIGNADSDTVHPIGISDPEKIVVIGDEIDTDINHIFQFNPAWSGYAGALGITDFDPPVIDAITRDNDIISAEIINGLSAYILYQAEGLEYIEKMTKDGDSYSGVMPSTATEYRILAQDGYFNTVQSELLTVVDTEPPYTSGHSPAPEATDVPVNVDIVAHVLDDGDGVDIATIVMTVEGVVVSPIISGDPADYTLTYDPPDDFANLQVVDVTINASDLASPANVMVPDVYSFTTEVATAPKGLLRVQTVPAVPTTIFLDGIQRDDWGLNWVKMPTGSYTLSFSDVYNFITPETVTVNYYPGTTGNVQSLATPIEIYEDTVTEVIVDFIELGNLRVETDPAMPATIYCDGHPMDDWAFWTNILPGEYTVSFEDLDGYITPEPQVVTVIAGATTHITGNYVAGSNPVAPVAHGLLRVQTDPGVPTTIFLDGIQRNDWGLNWVKMPAGSYTLSFSDVYGYNVPETVTVNYYPGTTGNVQSLATPIEVYEDTVTEVIVNFIELGNLRVETSPALPATIYRDGHIMDDWAFWCNIEPGEYTVSFETIDGMLTPPPLAVTVVAGATTHVIGNYDTGETNLQP